MIEFDKVAKKSLEKAANVIGGPAWERQECLKLSGQILLVTMSPGPPDVLFHGGVHPLCSEGTLWSADAHALLSPSFLCSFRATFRSDLVNVQAPGGALYTHELIELSPPGGGQCSEPHLEDKETEA